MSGEIGSILDVAIVLSALYIALSCVCSFVNEQIASLLSLRGKKLYLGVLNMVGGATPLVDAIFQHPLLSASSNDQGGIHRKNAPNRPSYVDARNFSMAFWQSILAGKAIVPAAESAAAGAASASPAPPGAPPVLGNQAAAVATAVVTEPKAFLDALRQSSPTTRCARASHRCS
jgi:hypothetical protein